MRLQLNDYEIAYESSEGVGPCVIFCPGFNSTMQGNKARKLKTFCIDKGVPFVRFDYSGHGESGGDFADGCISTWLADTLSVIDRVAKNDVILVGSSMGGWLCLLAALKRPERVRGLLLIACAADMTQHYEKRLDGVSQKRDEHGRPHYCVSNDYDDQQPYFIYQNLIDDGALHCLLDGPIDLDIPVNLIHGAQDEVVEWQRSAKLMSLLTSQKVRLLTVKSGDHRLSTQDDLNLICALLLDLLAS